MRKGGAEWCSCCFSPATSCASDKQGVCKVRAKIPGGIGGETMMEYKGYSAKVEFDNDDNIFHGGVINLRDVITFEGETVEELRGEGGHP